ncbi:helix-hairpin-helix domain-containing protein [Candidatus Sulfurimonas marisnigri]|uniref:Helix-hairpin-helix domain-containing protein n=1 Tax=Candidatus Sulfurimonas marisnigri TaxID=2740405 RepID=A0A7S7LZ19_9BACT|nr:helix-hairpin-helix domain-containing protein [Candidatus Sulfurimonas marisnigri]QOY54051.1 helix-hairpin-helix domain-containing protein [Candidatus Sulfurimonas marisnigri]
MKILTMIFLGVSLLFGTVDINNADQTELSSINGIGAKKADAIIKYRSTNCFKSIDELANVKGIGAKTVEKNRANLTANGCK